MPGSASMAARMKAMVVVMLLVCAARADERRQLRSLRAAAPHEVPARREVASSVSARVFDVRRVRAIEERNVLPDPWKPAEKKPWRPRVMPLPMGSMAQLDGSKGVKLKIRF
jgi:hypothetical protein